MQLFPNLSVVVIQNRVEMKNYKTGESPSADESRKFNPPSVTEYMTEKLITFKPETDIREVIESLLKNKITGAPVLNDQNELVGLIDDKDCLRVLVGNAYHDQPGSGSTAGFYMSRTTKSIPIDATIVDAANIFLSTSFKRLEVMDEKGRLAGQISRRDVLRAIHDMDKHLR